MFPNIGWFFKRWIKNIKFWRFLKSVFVAFGVFWTIVDFAFYVTDQSRIWVLANWWVFLLGGVLWAFYTCLPHDSFCYKLKNRDAVIEISVIDIFNVKASVIVPTNTFFDAGLNGVALKAQSVQGALLRKYYDGDSQSLEKDISKQLRKLDTQYTKPLKQSPVKKKEFEIGTIITLSRKNRTFYMLASSQINKNGRATSTVDGLRVSLDKLWEYIRENSDKGDVVIPVLGTGYARLPISREDVIRMIIKSYILSCSHKIYCNKLTIAIHPRDIDMFKLDLNDLDSFLKYSCDYVDFEETQLLSSK